MGDGIDVAGEAMREKIYTVKLTRAELLSLLETGSAVMDNLHFDNERGRFCEASED